MQLLKITISPMLSGLLIVLVSSCAPGIDYEERVTVPQTEKRFAGEMSRNHPIPSEQSVTHQYIRTPHVEREVIIREREPDPEPMYHSSDYGSASHRHDETRDHYRNRGRKEEYCKGRQDLKKQAYIRKNQTALEDALRKKFKK